MNTNWYWITVRPEVKDGLPVLTLDNLMSIPGDYPEAEAKADMLVKHQLPSREKQMTFTEALALFTEDAHLAQAFRMSQMSASANMCSIHLIAPGILELPDFGLDPYYNKAREWFEIFIEKCNKKGLENEILFENTLHKIKG